MKKVDIEKIISELVEPVVVSEGLRLWNVEYVKEGGEQILRIVVDKEGGVSINDCENISRKAEKLIDAADPIDESYIFEVSSAGLTRTLHKQEHFEESVGQEVEVKLFAPREKQKEFDGILLKTDFHNIIEIENSGVVLSFAPKEIAKINIKYKGE